MATKPKTRWRDAAEYVASLGLEAYLVGGAVRDQLLGRFSKDQDFVVPGVGHAELRRTLERHGRVENLEVAKQLVGVRLFPRDRAARAVAPRGIEFAPPRAERSTGPGRHDFEIVADPRIPLEQDMARRDFTVNALARRLSTGELVDPFDGADDLRRGVLRTVSPTSFREDPLRIVRGLRLVSEYDLTPDDATLAQMREHAQQVALVSGERIGGGLEADGMGELSRLLLGGRPAKALRIARDTGVLVRLLPEYGPAIGFEQEIHSHEWTLDEHHFEAVQHAADAAAPLQVRLALALHDLGKPASVWRGSDGKVRYDANPALGKPGHEHVGGQIAASALARLRYPVRLRSRVRRIVERHAFEVDDERSGERARRFLAEHGAELAFDLLPHKDADLRARRPRPDAELRGTLRRLAAFRRTVEAELANPYRLSDLAIDGSELIALGYEPGRSLGRALDALLLEVIADPSRNDRAWLLDRARGLLAGERRPEAGKDL